ncbi:MAG: protein translocase subunit SecD [Gammaproteobacteria bacterium]|nr:protein translocase subunit SecD [Gammaproteobacteria bacterium]MDH5799311.1 protein translocase subunit SecD [Gammaproteobacteria bacterium]
MLNHYPLWKYIIIVGILVVGLLYATPNIYGEDPALQISATRGAEVSLNTQETVREALQAGDISVRGMTLENSQLLVRLTSEDDQLKAQDLVNKALAPPENENPKYIVALNLAPRTPNWLLSINALPMYLGLDLRGGVHFLMEVDVETAIKQAEERYISEYRTLLRENRIRYSKIGRVADIPGAVEIGFKNADARDKGEKIIRRESDLELSSVDQDDLFYIRATINEKQKTEIRSTAVKQNITILRNRVNALGVSEPLIQQQGINRIVVQLPGVQDTARAKDILGATATLEFRLVEETADVQEAVKGKIPAGTRLYPQRDGGHTVLKNRVMLTGDYIMDASSGIDNNGSPAVFITLDGRGANIFSRVTGENIKKLMAVVFIETKVERKEQEDGTVVKTRRKIAEVINVARIQDQLSKRFQITGLDDTSEARNLALLLRAGALAAPIEIVEERTVGPSLGKDNISKGFMSVIIGFVLVLAFMLMWYKGFGLVANMALAFNLVIIIAVMSIFQFTLTLPGIAGIVLTVGMAVDANVLIFERIREEVANGNSPQASIHAGYAKALSTIADANITTLIAAVILFAAGTGPIKGFAITLAIGIVTSMFTAIMGTRGVINLWYGGKRVEKLSV